MAKYVVWGNVKLRKYERILQIAFNIEFPIAQFFIQIKEIRTSRFDAEFGFLSLISTFIHLTFQILLRVPEQQNSLRALPRTKLDKFISKIMLVSGQSRQKR